VNAILNAMIEDLDRRVGRMLEALHANGIAENSIVIFTIDDGGERLRRYLALQGSEDRVANQGV
jgi:arylsulfatase A-like enzyme